MEQVKVKTFNDLETWQQAYALALDIYRLSKNFPKDEQFGLTSQIRRAIVSVSSNIAEGFSRQSIADKSHFYAMAHGSLTEVQSQLYVARGVGYIDEEVFSMTYLQTIQVHKLLTGLIKSTKRRSLL
jgi:four helix bundle protein